MKVEKRLSVHGYGDNRPGAYRKGKPEPLVHITYTEYNGNELQSISWEPSMTAEIIQAIHEAHKAALSHEGADYEKELRWSEGEDEDELEYDETPDKYR
jgi:hypothetical protein